MSLLARIKRLENLSGMNQNNFPDLEHNVRFIGHGGVCHGGIDFLPDGRRQWLDANLQPVGEPVRYY